MTQTQAKGVIESIVVATDFSERSARAEAFAFSMAERFGAAVVFVHGIEPILGTDGDDGGSEFDEFYGRLRAKARDQLDVRIERAKALGLTARAHVELGPRWRVVLERAEVEDADIIIIGRRSYVDGGPVALGTTSQRVYFGSQRPVLIVPLDGEGAPSSQEVRS
jgi:nucleotide-binding universal stress UspA family protein